jgi:hypothetical protein
MRFAEQFYLGFRRRYRQSPFSSRIHKWKYWTRSTLKLLEDLGKKMGYRVMKEKPVRVDMTWFDARHLEPQVAIEYETDEKGVLESELVNLSCSSAKLKVLITYAKEGTQQDFFLRIKEEWSKRSKRTWNDELLTMFLVYSTEGGNCIFDHFEGGVVYPSEGRLVRKKLRPFTV